MLDTVQITRTLLITLYLYAYPTKIICNFRILYGTYLLLDNMYQVPGIQTRGNNIYMQVMVYNDCCSRKIDRCRTYPGTVVL